MTTTTKEALKEFVEAVDDLAYCVYSGHDPRYARENVKESKNNLLDALDKEPTRVDNPPVA